MQRQGRIERTSGKVEERQGRETNSGFFSSKGGGGGEGERRHFIPAENGMGSVSVGCLKFKGFQIFFTSQSCPVLSCPVLPACSAPS